MQDQQERLLDNSLFQDDSQGGNRISNGSVDPNDAHPSADEQSLLQKLDQILGKKHTRGSESRYND